MKNAEGWHAVGVTEEVIFEKDGKDDELFEG